MKTAARGAGWVILHIVWFGLTCADMMATFFWLEVPVVLVGLPVAIFAKSRRAKSLAVTALMGYVVWIPTFLFYRGW